MRYSPDDTTTHLDFNYYKARLFYAKTLDRRTDISVGAIADYYDSLSIDSRSHSVGAQASGGFNWSETLRSSLTLAYQQTKFDETDPRVLHETSNPWSAQFTTVYK